MRVLVRKLIAAATFLVVLGTSVAAGAVSNLLTPTETGVQNARLSAQPTITLRIGEYSAASVYVGLSRAAATAIKMDCTTGPTSFIQAAVSVASIDSDTGAISMAPASWTYPVSRSGMVRMQVAPLNDTFMVCKFSGVSATSDTISVYVQLGS